MTDEQVLRELRAIADRVARLERAVGIEAPVPRPKLDEGAAAAAEAPVREVPPMLLSAVAMRVGRREAPAGKAPAALTAPSRVTAPSLPLPVPDLGRGASVEPGEARLTEERPGPSAEKPEE